MEAEGLTVPLPLPLPSSLLGAPVRMAAALERAARLVVAPGFWIRASDQSLGLARTITPSYGDVSNVFSAPQFAPDYQAEWAPTVQDVGGARGWTFDPDGTNGLTRGDHLLTAQSLAATKWAHLSAGATVMATLRVPNTNANVKPFYATGYGSGSIGMSAFVQSGRFQFTWMNGSAYVHQGSTELLSVNTWYLLEAWYSVTHGVGMRINGARPDTSAQLYGSPLPATPSSANPTYQAAIGTVFPSGGYGPASVGPGFFFEGTLGQLAVFPGVLTGAQQRLFRRVMAAETGITLDAGIPPTTVYTPGDDPRIIVPELLS